MANNYIQLSFAVEMPEHHMTWCLALHAACEDAAEGRENDTAAPHDETIWCLAQNIVADANVEYTGVTL